MYFTSYFYGGAKRLPITTYKVHTTSTAEAAAEAVAEAAASKSLLAIHSIYEKLSNELPGPT